MGRGCGEGGQERASAQLSLTIVLFTTEPSHTNSLAGVGFRAFSSPPTAPTSIFHAMKRNCNEIDWIPGRPVKTMVTAAE